MQYLRLCMHSFQLFEVTHRIKSHINVIIVTTILFTRELLRFIMLVLHVHLQMFFRKSFKAAYDTRKHGDCRFVLLAMMLCVPNVIIFPYKKRKYSGQKMVCFEFGVLNLGTTTFDESETIESKCRFVNHLKPGLSRPGGPKR